MKKISSLLKKVDFFEKLATYGSRRAVLKSLSQDLRLFNQYIREARDLAKSAFNKMLVANEKLTSQSIDVMHHDMMDQDPSALNLESLEKYIDNMKSMYEQISRQSYSEKNEEAQTEANNAFRVLEKAVEKIQSARSAFPGYPVDPGSTTFTSADSSPSFKSMSYPSIDPELQRKIRNFVISRGLGVFPSEDLLSKTEDGKLGPETRKMIEMAKKYFNDKLSMSIGHVSEGPSGDSYLFNLIDKELDKAEQAFEPSGRGIEEIEEIYSKPYQYVPEEI